MCSSSVLVLFALAAAPSEVTLDDALKLALDGNAQLKVLRLEVEVARSSVPLAHDWEMPKFRVQFNDVQDIPTGQFRWYAGLQWRPPNPWEWKNGTDSAEAKLLQSRLELADLSWRIVRDVRLAWLDVSGAAAHEKLARDTVEVRRKLLTVLKKRLEQGQGTQIDLNLAQLGETDARQEQLRWQNAGLKAAQSVAYLVGQPVNPLPSVLGDEPPALPNMSELEARLEKHPKLEAIRAKVIASEANEKNLAAKRLPWPEVQVRLRQNAEVAPAPYTHDFQLGLTVPLAVTPAPQLDVARALTVRNRAQLDAELAQMKSELQILAARAEGLRDRWRTFEADYKTTIASHRQLQARVLSEGSLDPTLLLTADRQAIDLEHKRLEVQLDLARALVELEAVAGPHPEK
ncbi:MAG: TolC family protein [Archangium sp.]|nr:TolC family protein [Archangium sp.]